MTAKTDRSRVARPPNAPEGVDELLETVLAALEDFRPEGETKKRGLPKSEQDRRGAPDPVIRSSYGSGSAVGPHPASYGLLVASVKIHEVHGLRNVDSPLDLLVALGAQEVLSAHSRRPVAGFEVTTGSSVKNQKELGHGRY